MFRIHDPDKNLPLVLVEIPWPRKDEEDDPEGPLCPVLAVADPKEPDNKEMMTPLLALTERGLDINATALAELQLAGYEVPPEMFSEEGALKLTGEEAPNS